MVNFIESTKSYEAWLGRELTVVPQDLTHKHEGMREGVFPFLRATFYRFAQLYPAACPECMKGPQVLAVGDLHVENFGTWRDAEARLVWGINDFDEAARMPYTVDLARLAASAHLAIDIETLQIDHRDACGCILEGYKNCLEAGGAPFVLAGKHPWLRDMVNPGLRDPAVFWKKLEDTPAFEGKVPGSARRAIAKMMPRPRSAQRIVHRVAGMGSLGRQRFVAIAKFEGSYVCREAKALAPSAWERAQGDASGRIRYQKALDIAVRARDPWVRLEGSWIVRRLAPDCAKIDLGMFQGHQEESRLLRAMGWETANLHIGSGAAKKILSDLKKQPENWLHKAAAKMVAATRADWKEWRDAHPAAKPAKAVPKVGKVGKAAR